MSAFPPDPRYLWSQHAHQPEPEIEDTYRSSPVIAGWAGARPFPNRVPYVAGSGATYFLPSGPTSPRALLQQGTVPPTFPAGDYRLYMPERYAAPPFYAGNVASEIPGGRGRGAPGWGGGAALAETMATAVAMGLKKALPELATSIGVQVSRANGQQMHAAPAHIEPPIRSWSFEECRPAPVTVSDAAFVDIVAHLVPVGTVAVVHELLVQAESAAALDDVEIRVNVGGTPYPRYDSLNCPDLGQAGVPAKVNIRAIEQQRIVVQARSRTAATNHFVTGMLRGYDLAPSLMTNLDSINGWRGRESWRPKAR